jgi:hypothetical protein
VGTLSATNYDFTPFVNGTLHITKVHLTVTADDKTRTYGAANPAFTATITGFVNGETVAVVSGSPSFSGTGPSSTATTTVGDYVITPAVGTLSATNYDFTSFANGTLHITRVHLTVTAADKSRLYGSANPMFTATITGFVNGETIAVVSGSPTFGGTGPSSTATTSVGDYVITPAVGTLSATNYDFTPFINGTLHITPASLTITATNRSKTFGATYTPDTTPPSVDFNVTGLLNSDTVTSITLTCAGYPAGAGTGNYTVTPSAAMGTGLGNYMIGYVNGAFTVGSWTITGFYQPVDMPPTINTIKGGSTVPLKFNIYDSNGVEKTSVSDVMYGTVQVAEYSCSGGPEDPMGDLPNTGATALRYDTTGHQFIQNWQTPKAAGHCYRVRMTAIDGSVIEALFKTK